MLRGAASGAALGAVSCIIIYLRRNSQKSRVKYGEAEGRSLGRGFGRILGADLGTERLQRSLTIELARPFP